ncbi:MAG TPA: hypothetical protein VIK18_09145, partial [Pirellulales bacterium]
SPQTQSPQIPSPQIQSPQTQSPPTLSPWQWRPLRPRRRFVRLLQALLFRRLGQGPPSVQ